MKKQVILTVGVSGAGKTTYAEKLVKDSRNTIANINRDDIRMKISKTDNLLTYKYTKEKEKTVTRMQRELAEQYLQMGLSIIISDTNLDPTRWDYWKELAATHNAEFVVVYFPISLQDVLKRNQQRVAHIPESVIRDQLMKFEANFPDQINYWVPTPYVRPYAQKAIIVDIDGTLAHMNGRHPFDMTRVGEDDPDVYVIEMVNNMYELGYTVIIMSGRSEQAREQTEEWLKFHRVPYDQLHFRKNDDWRSDDIVKDEMFEQHELYKYDVRFVFDDRQKVVDMWRKKGLKVMQVERGDF